MIEASYNGQILEIKTFSKETININASSDMVSIGDYEIDFPGEYEKSGLLLKVKEIQDSLYYNFSINQKRLVVIFANNMEFTQENLSFFGDIDVLLIKGTKKSTALVENLEAKVVIPFGEGRDVFLNTLGQNLEETNKFKMRSELGVEDTEFINLTNRQ